MLKLILILVVLAIAAILIIAAFKPDMFRVERSTLIQATPDKLFPHINDLRNWVAWSTWEKMDPQMKKTYSTNSGGQGATYEWEGNKKVGHGRMTITESVAASKVVIQLDFITPFEAHNTADITLQPQGNSTLVTWAMYGPSPFISKLFSVLISMDKMIGKDFEASLANLKTVAERP
ncbi:MAG: SRPBCC family protein [Gallionella sp.]|nr:SRPBCC family protein [Gallionella sp.]